MLATPNAYKSIAPWLLVFTGLFLYQRVAEATPPPALATLPQPAQDPMLALLQQRAAEKPGHSDTWRLIGRAQQRLGNMAAALAATARALELNPDNAAAHFDYGQLLLEQGNTEIAETHFQRVLQIAPTSKYATTLQADGYANAPPSTGDVDWSLAFGAGTPGAAKENTEVHPASYKIQTFDGGDDLDRELNRRRSDVAEDAPKRLRLFVEGGVLYNTNVSLTPISRELADPNAESFQGFLSPELEWIAREHEAWRLGPLARGFFTVNEQQQSAFDLANFEPGGFLERDFSRAGNDFVGRLDYVYSINSLGGERFGDRHSVTASLIKIRPDLDVIYSYFTVGFSDFDDDGDNPSVSSLDGTSYTTGISRFFQSERQWLTNWSLGCDFESADTEGADFRYRAITFHTAAEAACSERLSFLPEFGIGGRDYPDFTGTVNRDELTWRLSGKLRWQTSQRLALSLVASHDRFHSSNKQFDAKRTQGGIVSTLRY